MFGTLGFGCVYLVNALDLLNNTSMITKTKVIEVFIKTIVYELSFFGTVFESTLDIHVWYVRARVRACVRACVCVCVGLGYVCWSVCVSVRGAYMHVYKFLSSTHSQSVCMLVCLQASV